MPKDSYIIITKTDKSDAFFPFTDPRASATPNVLAIAVAIKAQGKDKHKVEIGIDAAVQAAGMAYCSKRAHEHRCEEGEPEPGKDEEVPVKQKRGFPEQGIPQHLRQNDGVRGGNDR